jgi:ComF family protein
MDLLLQKLFSITCYHCNLRSIDTDIGLCFECALEVPYTLRKYNCSSLILENWSLASYHGAMGSLLRRCKYRPDRTLMNKLSARLAAASLDLPYFEAIVHVPIPWRRRFARGFDQGEILARAIHKQLGVPHVPILKRIEQKEQAGIRYADRKRNLLARFKIKEKYRLPKRILLVDDVVTTGNTMESCAAELYHIGVREIIGFSLASALI